MFNVLLCICFGTYSKMRDFEGGGYGIGILSKHPLERVEVFRYAKPGTGERTDVRSF